MSFRTTYLLFGLLAVILVVFGVTLWRLPSEGADSSAYILPSLHSPTEPVQQGDIDRVELTRTSGESLAFARDPQTKGWRLTRPRTARADTQAVTGLIRQAFDARRAQTDRPPK